MSIPLYSEEEYEPKAKVAKTLKFDQIKLTADTDSNTTSVEDKTPKKKNRTLVPRRSPRTTVKKSETTSTPSCITSPNVSKCSKPESRSTSDKSIVNMVEGNFSLFSYYYILLTYIIFSDQLGVNFVYVCYMSAFTTLIYTSALQDLCSITVNEIIGVFFQTNFHL